MKKALLIFSVAILFIGCSSTKRNERLLSQGDYEKAIDLAVKKLQRDKTSGKNDDRILILEDAFIKAQSDDLRRISALQKQPTSSAAKEIFYTYKNMQYIQDQIRPLLPLYIKSARRNAQFKLKNYGTEITKAKQNLLVYLYDEAAVYTQRQTVKDYRTAYNVYCEIDELQFNYKDVAQLKEDARYYGTNFVFVTVNNRSGQLIPIRLERELLDFNTYGLDEFWTVYHANRENNTDYNYGISLNFQEIAISPERLNEKTERRSKRVKDGWEYALDRNGNVRKDSLGNDIKIDKYSTVNATITYTEQTKSAFVGGEVVYRDLVARRDLNNYPLSTEFVFENTFARFRGDNRALTTEDRRFLNSRFIPFPANEQMVYDAGEEIKIRFKQILNNNSF